MSKRNKNIITTTLLVLAFIQGPVLYYFTEGFIKLFFLGPVACAGLYFSVLLAIRIVKYRSTNTAYHIVGLILSTVFGVLTLTGSGMEYLDFWLRLGDRNKVIEGFKSNKIRSTHLGNAIFPLSSGDNDVEIWKNDKGVISIAFYIDRGFIDHASLFLYTNDPGQIKDFDDRIKYSSRDTVVTKMKQNWYRVGY